MFAKVATNRHQTLAATLIVAAIGLAVACAQYSAPHAVAEVVTPAPTFDWRQLERGGADAAPGNEIRFPTPLRREEDRIFRIATISGFVLLSLTVIGLLLRYNLESRRRSRAERALTESEHRMALATSATKSGLWRIDEGGEAIGLTDTSIKMFGLPKSECYDLRDLSGVLHPADRRLFERTMLSGARRRTPVDFQFRIGDESGDVRWIAAKAHAGSHNGEPSPFLEGLFSDVTELKTLENERDQQRQEVAHLMRQSVVNELSASIAHELNQALTAIMSNAEAALDQLGRRDADQTMIRESLQDIVEADLRATEVISRVRRLIRKEGRKRELIDTSKLVKSTQCLLRNAFAQRNISFIVEADAALPSISGDYVQLQQVLINILMNAMEAIVPASAARREVTVTVTYDRDHIKFNVTDTGQGIATEMLGKVFEPLMTTKPNGLGLGLSICATIAEQHGGEVTLANGPVGGASATLTLPLQIQMEAAL